MRYAITAGLLGLGLAATALVATSGAEAASGVAPGAPGATALWTAGDKDGFGTATTSASNVWHTLGGGELTEVYYPNLGTPAVRDLQFVVTDGKSWVDREREDTDHALSLVDPRSLSYRQVNTDPDGRYRITKTYTTDPSRVRAADAGALRVADQRAAAAVRAVRPEPVGQRRRRLRFDRRHRAGGLRRQGGERARRRPGVHEDLQRLSRARATAGATCAPTTRWTGTTPSAPDGNVVQTGRLELTGKPGSQDATLALGFGTSAPAALAAANASLASGFGAAERGLPVRLARLPRRPLTRPRSVAGHEELYDVSLMVLAASEDKTYRGAGIASPTMAWVWGLIPGYNGPYHLVWSRDLYEMATAQIAAGDRAAAGRALDYLWTRQQQPDGCLPQNSNLDGSPHWGGLQLDEVADPILLAWQLGRTDAATWSHVQRAAACILANGPGHPGALGERDRLLAREHRRRDRRPGLRRADRAGQRRERRRGPLPLDRRRLALAPRPLDRDHQRAAVAVARTSCGSACDGNANAGTTYTIADGGPTVDQRTVVDPSFLELVRLGVAARRRPRRRSRPCPSSTASSASTPRTGSSGTATTTTATARPPTAGRSAPTTGSGACGRSSRASAASTSSPPGSSSGDVAAARAAATKRLDAIANTANDGLMLPEQVWDHNPPAGTDGRHPGTGTGSATPLGWTHAQFIRLAWSIDAGRPVERPTLVSCRYGGPCSTSAPLRTRSRPPQPTRTGERSTTPSKQPSFTSSLPDQCSVMAGCCRRTGLRRSTMMRPGRSRPGNNGVGFSRIRA